MNNEMILTVGIPEEQIDFGKRHRLFLERLPNLRTALNIAFIRKGRSTNQVDRVVFYLGRIVVEEFWEITVLCGNGYGIGALKLLRGMYERCVTARYLHLKPESVDDWFDFEGISDYKLMKAISATFGDGALDRTSCEEIESRYKTVRDQFLVSDCEKCGTKRVNYTWSKVDLVSMARICGSIGDLIVPSYYMSTREAHSTANAMVSRLREFEDDGITFDGGPQREIADQTLMTAHNVLLNALDLQKDHFRLDELEVPLQTCLQDFLDTWTKKSV